MPNDRRHLRLLQPSGGPCLRRRATCSAVVVLLGATLIRAAVIWGSPGAFDADPDGYRAIADNLLRHGTFALVDDIPTAYRPPLYPWVVAACLAVDSGGSTALGVAHLLAGVLTVWLTFRLAQRLGLGRWAPIAALLVAVDPILLAQSRLVMTETLAALLAVGSLSAIVGLATRPRVDRALLAGLCLGLASLCRPTFLPWAAICCLVIPLVIAGGKRVRLAVAMAVGVSLCLLPWGLRNAMQFGRPIVTTTHGGYTLLLGNNVLFYRHLQSDAGEAVWTADALQRELPVGARFANPGQELAADRLLSERAWSVIAAHPRDFVRACLYRVGRLWGVLPLSVEPSESTGRRVLRMAVAVGYAVELPLAVVGLVVTRPWRRARPPMGSGKRRTAVWTAGLLLASCFTAVHAVYWTDLRMRAPLIPAVGLAAAAAASGRVPKPRNEPPAAARGVTGVVR